MKNNNTKKTMDVKPSQDVSTMDVKPDPNNPPETHGINIQAIENYPPKIKKEPQNND